ncbi:hypothetical protein [Culicoidibacter larvae]|uniref:Uncharacterized protein n=1 Tax=Culicoidibacter larvae TaxID=2579976 RepID=A0A5R8Q7D7_9FIRM|nr:hypothetical protein [Culicoidibacter larvae]TLG70281.1 hypothetical protein FEZ08_11880 [Culicoidibacter larvae]
MRIIDLEQQYREFVFEEYIKPYMLKLDESQTAAFVKALKIRYSYDIETMKIPKNVSKYIQYMNLDENTIKMEFAEYIELESKADYYE